MHTITVDTWLCLSFSFFSLDVFISSAVDVTTTGLLSYSGYSVCMYFAWCGVSHWSCFLSPHLPSGLLFGEVRVNVCMHIPSLNRALFHYNLGWTGLKKRWPSECMKSICSFLYASHHHTATHPHSSPCTRYIKMSYCNFLTLKHDLFL